MLAARIDVIGEMLGEMFRFALRADSCICCSMNVFRHRALILGRGGCLRALAVPLPGGKVAAIETPLMAFMKQKSADRKRLRLVRVGPMWCLLTSESEEEK